MQHVLMKLLCFQIILLSDCLIYLPAVQSPLLEREGVCVCERGESKEVKNRAKGDVKVEEGR